MNNQAIIKPSQSSLKITSDNHSKQINYSSLNHHSTNSSHNYVPYSKSINLSNKTEGKEQNECQSDIGDSSNFCCGVVESSLGAENYASDGTSPKEITAEKVPSEVNEDWSAAEYSSIKKSTEEIKELNTYTEISKITRFFFDNNLNDIALGTSKSQQSNFSIK